MSSASASARACRMKAAVLYHYPCPDGAFAALAAHLYFSAISIEPLFFPNTVYSPLTPQQLPLRDIHHLYLLDFVGPSGFVQEISSKVPSVVVLDHHKTALRTPMGGNVTGVIDMNRSGATIAFDYFKTKFTQEVHTHNIDKQAVISEFDRVRRLFDYVEDGDLWRWTLPNSKAFSGGFKDLNIQFDLRLNPSLFQQLLSLDLESLITQGMASLSAKQKLIDEALDESYEIALGAGAYGHCLAVNADSISELRSELGHQLATKSRGLNLRASSLGANISHEYLLWASTSSKAWRLSLTLIVMNWMCGSAFWIWRKHLADASSEKHFRMKVQGIAAVVYRVPELENDQMLKISLRSVDNEDTTPISREFGGGGHRNASSFLLGSAEFEPWKVGC